ncbi:PTS system, (possibly glucose-specific) IIA component [Listeria cornellensis FSL F6-0969]|uniref:PTS system, (Possibly glucose-specific) IIA component n=1 Tax=Listeria cornellensis FSL F6-0969 TaxID=1265820 RepID=W7C3Y2_9LIST|nr:PTS system, (possibly glucose-specific) IIA component [Listeria cornellensis FSL F6-0969]
MKKNASSTVIPMVVTNSMENKYDFDWKTVTDVVAGQTVVFESKAR